MNRENANKLWKIIQEVAKTMMDDWQNDTCAGKIFKNYLRK